MLAEQELEKARKAVAKQLFAQTDEIIFTSGGTEANNLALFGTAYAKKRRGTKIVTTSVEHSSIMESCKRLEQEGFEIVADPAMSDVAIAYRGYSCGSKRQYSSCFCYVCK